MVTWIRIYALLSRKHTSRDSCVFGVKFWTQIFVCVKKLTLSNSASMQVLYNCSWFTIWRFILDLRTFVAKSALSRLRALGGSFWPKHFNGPGAPHPCPLPSFIAWNGDLQQQRWGPNGDKMWTWKVYIWQIDQNELVHWQGSLFPTNIIKAPHCFQSASPSTPHCSLRKGYSLTLSNPTR